MNCVYAKYKLDQSAHFFPWKTYRRQVQIRQKNAFPEAFLHFFMAPDSVRRRSPPSAVPERSVCGPIKAMIECAVAAFLSQAASKLPLPFAIVLR